MAKVFKALRGKYDRLVIPACGQFSMAFVALSEGWTASQVIAGDVSLFSTVLAHAIQGKSIEGLDIKVRGKPAPVDPAECLYLLKLGLLSYQSRHYYQKLYIRDMVHRKEDHVKKIREDIEAMKTLKGMTYEAVDMFKQLEQYADDDKAVIWVNPPGYLKGYAKMFDSGHSITWDEPEYLEFKPNEHHNYMREMMRDRPALFFWYRYNALEPEDIPFAIFTEQKGKDRWDYTLCNRPAETGIPPALWMRKAELQHRNLKVLPHDYEIREDSEVKFIETNLDSALYYRDLWVHRLGTTGSYVNYLMVIDGNIAGAVGFSIGYIRKDVFNCDVEEGWGMTAYSSRHQKINRLLMMMIKSNQFLKNFDTMMFTAKGISTTCLSKYPEMKINRGIYKLTARVKEKNGDFKLRYRADRTPQSYAEVLKEWLKKYG